MVEVKTFLGQGSMDDQYIPKCQWLNLDANPEGDEMTAIPRRGSVGLVFWIDGEPFFFGYFKPLGPKGSALTGEEPARTTEGDKVISTVAKNRIAVKSSGLIELYAKQTLFRIMFPKDSSIQDLCRRYSLKADGGYQEWTSDELTQETRHYAEYRRDLLRSFVVIEEKGAVDTSTLYSMKIGPGIPGVQGTTLPVYTYKVGITGEVTQTVTPPVPEGTPIGVTSIISPTGEVTFQTGPLPVFYANISPLGDTTVEINKLLTLSGTSTGAFTLKNPIATVSVSEAGDIEAKNAIGSAAISAAGDIDLKNALASASLSSSGDITIKTPTTTLTLTAAGEAKIEAVQKITIDSKLGVDINSVGPINVNAVGPIAVKGLGLQLDGGTGPTDFALTFPTTLSPFTGSPLVPFSSTIQMSK